MRSFLLIALLCGVGTALAQSPAALPSPATCAQIVADSPRALTPALQDAVLGTLQAYQTQVGDWQRRLAARPATPAEQRELKAFAEGANAYLKRLLRVAGWPSDTQLQEVLLPLLMDLSEAQWCAGQAALRAARTPEERAQGARLTDRGLVGLGRSQRYGTVFQIVGRTATPAELEDAANVEVRRAAAGLPTLAVQKAEIEATLPELPVPPGLKRPVELRPACQAFTNAAALNTPLTSERLAALLTEANRLVTQDQASRRGEAGARDLQVVDAESTAWLKRTLRTSGWPSTNRSNAQLSFTAWLLTQHADRSPELQACVLDLIGQQRSTPAEGQNLAYLTDRVRLARGEEQVYGTQVTYDDVQGRATPRMLSDPTRVNERRAKVGLGLIEDYLKGFERPRP